MSLIYLDYNATTPVAPDVLEAMLPWFGERFWNAASAHAAGGAAGRAVDDAREHVAAAVGARPSEVVFTSGATEANNLALKGVVEFANPDRRRVLVGATEHKAVLDVADWLVSRGVPVDVIPVTRNGELRLDRLEALLGPDVALVSVMTANNETGVLSPLRDVIDLAHGVGALVHTDATQALGRVPLDLGELDVDLASFSAHKAYGPKGVGALVVRRRTAVAPLLHGGGHETGKRSGTLNVPGIVGFGAAAVRLDGLPKGAFLIERLVRGLRDRIGEVEVVSGTAERLANTVNLRFVGADAEAVMVNAPEVAVSSGSACTSAIPEPSHVLRAMGLTDDEAYECLRFSVGEPTTVEEIDAAIDLVSQAVHRVRELTAVGA